MFRKARLYRSSSEDSKLLIGYDTKSGVTLLACASTSVLSGDEEKIQNLKEMLPGGVTLVGICMLNTEKTPDFGKHDKYFNEMEGHRLCVSISKADGKFTAITYEEACAVDIQIVSDNFLEQSLIARCRCNIPITFVMETSGRWKQTLNKQIERVIERVTSQYTLFHLTSSNILLRSDGSSEVPDHARSDSLFSYLDTGDGEGVSTRSRKKEKHENCLSFDVYADLSHACLKDKFPSCSPVINYNRETVKTVHMTLGIDAVSIFPQGSLVDDMASVMRGAMKNQLKAMKRCICDHSKEDQFYTPEVFHFQPLELPALFTLIYPGTKTDDQLEQERKDIHKCLCLPTDRPLFRRPNRYRFQNEGTTDGYLLNVHKKCPKSKVSDGTVYTVQGNYSYHHYMQDRFDDNKWGCAYRSLQTLVSWFILQGYTDKAIPTHGQIQQILVDIGDKEPSFVGSRKWIGSMEVSFVLDTLLGVTSKILNVSSGADLSGKGRELAAHFTTQGTPIMIGGGVLAHTILGVDYNEVTGDINFLVLDPHYTGAEDIKIIIDKGWCGWKDGNFWDKNAHYNLCMPQRPHVI